MIERSRIERLELPSHGNAGIERVSMASSGHGRHTAIGTIKLFAAEALILPTGLATTAFLTRQLGPELYGLFTVVVTLVIWVELSTTLFFSRVIVKFVAEAADWRAVASTMALLQVLISLGATVLMIAIAPTLGLWLKSAELAKYLRLFALDIPLFALINVHRSTLIGMKSFDQRALLAAGRWLSRMVLIFLLVGLGFSLTGAILACIGSSIVELILARLMVQIPFPGRFAIPIRYIGSYALPIFFYTIGMRLFSRLDLMMVKALSKAPEAAGFYAAAQSFNIMPGLFGSSLSPLLLATLTQLLREGKEDAARAMARQSMRLVLCLLPLAGLVAGEASEIASLIYGRTFLPAGQLVAMLIFAAMAIMMISINTVILTAAGRPGWTIALTGPLVPLAFGANLVLVPRFGAAGAAAATTALAWLGAGMTTLAVYRQLAVYPSPVTMLRATLVTLLIYFLSSFWNSSGVWLMVELSAMTAVIFVCMVLLGEFTGMDLAFVRSLLSREQIRPPEMGEPDL
jgi:O-antigen/teichoic acid export membrane protein